MRQSVSIIIPVYNASESLERCIESIALGEFRDLDIILVEDCSKDNSWDVCRLLSERFKNVRCYQNKKNSGVSYTRNQGLRFANSEYIMFVDSDDWVSGKYVKTMVEAADNNSDSLIVCGLYYLDNVAGYKREYLWNDGAEDISLVSKEYFFDLVNQFLLQQLWNKIFRRAIIEKNNVQFDESQNMGEDFQFVLDYMQAARIKNCMVINQPLYYYIRANSTSLMSKFGFTKPENIFERYKHLYKISGIDNAEVKSQYLQEIRNTRDNLIYQIAHSSSNKQGKLTAISRLVGDDKASEYYRKQQLLICKEKILHQVGTVQKIPQRIKEKLHRISRDSIASRAKKQLIAERFSIISQNCIGGVLYHDMGLKFLSPTVNLFFKEPDFVRFVQNLEYYMGLKLEMRWEEEYPVGSLGDVSIYFMHYRTCREAKESWEKRKERIIWDKILVLATDMAGFDDKTWIEWNKIKYPKILFTVKEINLPGVVSYPKYREIGHVPDLIPDREFYKDGILMRMINYL